MAITVKKLIKLLEKQDPNALVAWRDHDQGYDEMNGFVNDVGAAEQALLNNRTTELEHYGKKAIVVLSS